MSNFSPNDQDAYHATPEEARESQNQRIVQMYNDIKYYKTSTVGYQAVVRTSKRAIQDVVAKHRDPDMKDRSVRRFAPRWSALEKLGSLHAGQILLLEVFEMGFREEWKQKKKEGLERRHRFLIPKLKELDRLEEAYRLEVARLSKEAGIT